MRPIIIEIGVSLILSLLIWIHSKYQHSVVTPEYVRNWRSWGLGKNEIIRDCMDYCRLQHSHIGTSMDCLEGSSSRSRYNWKDDVNFPLQSRIDGEVTNDIWYDAVTSSMSQGGNTSSSTDDASLLLKFAWSFEMRGCQPQECIQLKTFNLQCKNLRVLIAELHQGQDPTWCKDNILFCFSLSISRICRSKRSNA